jgi:hypothetical protein
VVCAHALNFQNVSFLLFFILRHSGGHVGFYTLPFWTTHIVLLVVLTCVPNLSKFHRTFLEM